MYCISTGLAYQGLARGSIVYRASWLWVVGAEHRTAVWRLNPAGSLTCTGTTALFPAGVSIKKNLPHPSHALYRCSKWIGGGAKKGTFISVQFGSKKNVRFCKQRTDKFHFPVKGEKLRTYIRILKNCIFCKILKPINNFSHIWTRVSIND